MLASLTEVPAVPVPTEVRVRRPRTAKQVIGTPSLQKSQVIGMPSLVTKGACNHETCGCEDVEAEWKMSLSRGQKKKLKAKAAKSEGLRMFRAIEPEGVNAIADKDGWEFIEFALDSGATETVVGEEMLGSVETKEGAASRRGVEYEIANGETIPNLGEKRFMAVSEEGVTRNITAQVCNVNKALMSVKKVMKAGNRVVFDDEGSYVQDKATGEKIWAKDEGGMFMIKMWVNSKVGF